jgi:hypothetical protein
VTDAAHAAAFLTLLNAVDDPPPLVVYDGAVPQLTAPPYVVVYFADADPIDSPSTHLTHQARRHVTDAYCHSVGSNGTAARMVADRVRGALLGVIPTIPGRSCFPIRRTDGQPAQRDETTGRLVMDKVDIYRLSSIPA